MSGSTESESSQPDRRKDNRVPISTLVRLRFSTFGDFVAEHATNLSQSGMFIRASQPPEKGSLVFLQFSLEDGSQLVEGVAEVVRTVLPGTNEPPGFGVQFKEMNPDSVALIRGICDRLALETK